MRARRTDGNHSRLRTQFEGLGGTWLPLVPEQEGTPDALLGWRGMNKLVEVKDPEKPPSKRRLRPGQEEWRDAWQGEKPVKVETMADILALFP